ncbi:MAG: DUF3823 domain-containing protein [Petrimonas sp.]|nr:DUF3823 domain-containing protein [Petrimonas sp.]
MKSKIAYFVFSFVLVFLFSRCEKDNYDAPTSMLTGKVTYNNEALGVRSNALQLELWQHGYQNFVKIPVFINQDGSYSAVLFDGNYKLVRMNGAPWENNVDSIDVVVKGNTIVDVPVVPYFTVNNVTFQKNGNQLTASFVVNKVSTQRNLKSVRLFLGKTILTDNGYNIARSSVEAVDVTLGSPTTLSVSIPDAYANSVIYARVGVETDGIGQLLYSVSEKIQ